MMFIDPKVYSGGAEGRIEKEMRSYALLDSLGIEYRRVDHEHADTIEACEQVEGLLECKICKNLFLTNRQQTDFYLLIMPGEKPFKTKLLSKQIGSARLSFASPEHMEKYLDITPGSVSILGLMNDKSGAVRLLVDRDLLKEEYFGCHPCINTSSLRLKTADVLEKLLPAMGHEPSFVDLPWVIEE
ncbi:MAG: prolyl-tRNA synthetase associated domain-containing protein [Candidatus Limivicinus sp.]|nr:prolyl-tRNA synthetase associated domain-containing protein [Candidatus Limivicinus sp.]